MVYKSQILKLYEILCRIFVQVYWILICGISEAAYVLNGSYIGYGSLFNVDEYRQKCFQYYYFPQFVQEKVGCV
jgi:hypothetical protein